MAQKDEPLISIPTAAKAVDVTRQVLWRQVKAGTVRSHDGLVYLSEVIEDRQRRLDPAHCCRHRREKAAARKRKPVATYRRWRRLDTEPLVCLSELVAAQARMAAEVLARTEGDRVYLAPLFDATVSRADAEALLAAYRGGTDEANMHRIRELHARLDLK